MNEDEFIVDFFGNLLEELEAATVDPPRRRVPANLDPFSFSDAQFIKHFRLTKSLVLDLIQIIEPVIEQRSRIDIKTKVLCALHFFGTGSYQTPSAKLNCLNISQPSASRCISEIVDALNHPNVFGTWIRFPSTHQELHEISRSFCTAYGFPGIVGCIDCTHISIVPPQRPFEERSYVNRKHYHSINAQLICDSNLKY
ncbi:putative nuclease HARBI1 [Ostrinia furnacalis]|uniref:putative nuclease HARBI1 n=1 Tax=Ostrinia furnacalis TaxID=93504 RepID=UPI00103A0F98|nr:putative nuclease HARBI1 [Ostrinia furnacalis]